MQQVTPTTKWQRNTLPIPVGSSPPVRLPLNKPAVLSINDQAAAYLVDNGYAVYCNHLGQPLEESEPAATPPPEEPLKESEPATTPPEEAEEESEPTLEEEVPAEKSVPAATPPEEAEEESEPTWEEKAMEFLRKNSPDEIAVLIRGIDQEKAEELATEQELTWEKVLELLSKRQLNALKRYVKQKD